MKKNDTKFWVDFILFVAMFGLVFTGIIMAFFTSSGPYVSEASKYFLKLHKHQWGIIHFYFAILFSLLIIIHLILEWNWIKEKTRNLFRKLWVLIPLVFSAVIIIFISWYITPKTGHYYKEYGKGWKDEINSIKYKKKIEIEKPHPLKKTEKRFEEKVTERGEINHEQDSLVITGQLSLNDIERKTGVSAKNIAEKLGLPVDASFDERLGKLKRLYLFSINDVRDAVNSLMKKKSAVNSQKTKDK